LGAGGGVPREKKEKFGYFPTKKRRTRPKEKEMSRAPKSAFEGKELTVPIRTAQYSQKENKKIIVKKEGRLRKKNSILDNAIFPKQ